MPTDFRPLQQSPTEHGIIVAASVTTQYSVQYVVDGVNAGSGSWNGGVYNIYNIGTSWTMPLTGNMYDFRLYSVARTAAQITRRHVQSAYNIHEHDCHVANEKQYDRGD